MFGTKKLVNLSELYFQEKKNYIHIWGWRHGLTLRVMKGKCFGDCLFLSIIGYLLNMAFVLYLTN